MKEDLQSKMVEILTSIQTAAGKASDFAMEQLPDVALSYVTYGRASLTLYVIIGAAILLASAICFVVMLKKDQWEFTPVLVLPVILGGVTIAQNLSAFLLVWFAPKVWLLKELASLIK